MGTLTCKEVTMHLLDDDMGHPLGLDRHPTRVVSLVPSITEAIAATVPESLVGATDWCVQPVDLDVARVRGTKNPDHAAIARLHPDLVVANQEENRRIDVERLRESGIPVWVTVVESVDQALESLRRLLADVLGAEVPDWLVIAAEQWRHPGEFPSSRTVVPIWRDPWMVVGPGTFCRDLVQYLGLTCLPEKSVERYPKVDLAEMKAWRPDVVLLPDEPYQFSSDDGPEMFPDIPTALVSGRDLTWYGPSMATARATLSAQIAAVLDRG
jgi:ABC-type Fe3+-hydroxamate transport system substrate-binding protein